MIAAVFLSATIVLEIIVFGGLVISLVWPKHRVWPFPEENSWQYRYIKFATRISFFLFFVLGFLDWNTFFLTHWLRMVFGLILIGVGAIVFLWAVRTYRRTFAKAFLEEVIEMTNTPTSAQIGVKGKLVTQGPYKYSRNPQYLANILLFSGIILLFNSSYQVLTGAFGIICFLLAAFVEESWLREKFEEEYYTYSKRVPRFI